MEFNSTKLPQETFKKRRNSSVEDDDYFFVNSTDTKTNQSHYADDDFYMSPPTNDVEKNKDKKRNEDEIPSSTPTEKPSYTHPIVTKWVKVSNCNIDPSMETGMYSIIPLDRCIPNVEDYQIYRHITSTSRGRNITLAYQNYNNLDKCQKKQYSGEVPLENMFLETFSNICKDGLKVEVLSYLPNFPSDTPGLIEAFYSSEDCSSDDVMGFNFIPTDTCIIDNSLLILQQNNDFQVKRIATVGLNQAPFIQFLEYKSADGVCENGKKFTEQSITPQCTLSINTVRGGINKKESKSEFDALGQVPVYRAGYACGDYLRLNVVPLSSGPIASQASQSGSVSVNEASEEDSVIALSTVVAILGAALILIIAFILYQRHNKSATYRQEMTGSGTDVTHSTSKRVKKGTSI